jgi:hypothetical protein
MTECDEVAAAMPPLPKGASFTDALRIVRARMSGESETVISNVAWALLQAQGDAP